jgi:hypothetical protein
LGGSVSFTVSVANTGENPATGAMLAVEPSAGLSINSLEGPNVRCDVSDLTAQHCSFGNIPAGGTVALAVGASIRALGTERAHFSIAHGEPDPRPDRNSVTVVIAAVKAD